MKDNNQLKKDALEVTKKLKTLLIIYDFVRNSSKNIDEFNTLKIFLSNEMKNRTIQEVFEFFKKKTYSLTLNINNKTKYFINLINNILLYDYIPKVSDVQLLLAYYLVYIFHKQTGKEDLQQNQKLLRIYLITAIGDYSCYFDILKMTNLLKEENENDSEAQFYNKCKIIQNLNPFEFNKSLNDFLLKKNSIPQYGITFPNLDSNDDENSRNNKIKDIYFLLDVIKASLEMNFGNIRFELFNKYINQKDRLVAVNKVLDSLNKEKLGSLDGDDLQMKIELYKENSSFLQNENNKSNQTIDNLLKETNSLNERIQSLLQNAKELSQKLSNEKVKLNNLKSQFASQAKQFEKLYEESQNIKYRDICRYIFDYFISILNDEEYVIAIKSDYKTAISYVENEINRHYGNYKSLLVKDKIVLGELLNVLLKHKKEYNSVTHDCVKEEAEFIRLITNFESEKIGEKFELLFNNTPLLKNFCFNKRNEIITKDEIKNAILKL